MRNTVFYKPAREPNLRVSHHFSHWAVRTVCYDVVGPSVTLIAVCIRLLIVWNAPMPPQTRLTFLAASDIVVPLRHHWSWPILTKPSPSCSFHPSGHFCLSLHTAIPLVSHQVFVEHPWSHHGSPCASEYRSSNPPTQKYTGFFSL